MKKLPPLFRYPGSKSQLAAWIGSLTPQHESKAIPFAGSLGYFLNSSRSRMESVNDADGELINFLVTLRDNPEALIAKIEATYYAAYELEIAQQPAGDAIEKARRFYTRCWLSFKPYENGRRLSFRRQYSARGKMTSAANMFKRTAHLSIFSERLKGCLIDNLDVLDYIDRYDNVDAFFYVDPPYLFDTRENKNIYQVEMGDEEAHRSLATVLNQIEGKALLSGYASPLYAELYESEGWERVDRRARINGANTAMESIWVHPRARVRRLL